VRAGISVIADFPVGGEDTLAAVAGIVGAGVGVITHDANTALAGSIETRVTQGTGVPIVARFIDVHVGAATVEQAAILGARVVIVTL
jgi:hypothetical protein